MTIQFPPVCERENSDSLQQVFGATELMRSTEFLPKEMQLLFLDYYFAPEPVELFGRVSCCTPNVPIPNGFALIVVYEKVNKLFNQLVKFGDAFNLRPFAERQIQMLLQTCFVFKVATQPEVVYFAQTMEANKAIACWKFQLAHQVEKDYEIAKGAAYSFVSTQGRGSSRALPGKLRRADLLEEFPDARHMTDLTDFLRNHKMNQTAVLSEKELSHEQVKEVSVVDPAVPAILQYNHQLALDDRRLCSLL